MSDSDSETCHCCARRDYRCDMVLDDLDSWLCLACADYFDCLLADV